MFFRKKEVNTESIFKDASELKATKYPIKTPEEIRARIEAANAAGKRSVFFADAQVLKSTVKELRAKKYRVKDRGYCGSPSFEVMW